LYSASRSSAAAGAGRDTDRSGGDATDLQAVPAAELPDPAGGVAAPGPPGALPASAQPGRRPRSEMRSHDDSDSDHGTRIGVTAHHDSDHCMIPLSQRPDQGAVTFRVTAGAGAGGAGPDSESEAGAGGHGPSRHGTGIKFPCSGDTVARPGSGSDVLSRADSDSEA
jgi:hypothetical protein